MLDTVEAPLTRTHEMFDAESQQQGFLIVVVIGKVIEFPAVVTEPVAIAP